MNKKILFLSAIIVAAWGIHSCRRDIKDRSLTYPALNPLKADTNAGNWKPILLSSASEFPVDAPLAVTSNDYKSELLEIKSWQANITDEQQDNIDYWSAGSVLRWNEIMRELVAKYNLPPYQNADGTYPLPNAANPLAYPFFPFANPPYAARAYAYVSAAQYDAVVAAYHYKSKLKRPTPHQVDNSVKELIPVTAAYAYPSEDAVIAGAAAEMMKLLFPGDQSYIQQKVTAAKNARIASGANVRSDWDAGEKLGKMVAQKFLTRARNDKAGKAVGTPADWAKLATDVEAKGEVAWKSLESPARPPMLPLFGNVRGFLMDSSEVVMGRPLPPPLTNSEQFKKETKEVLEFSKKYDREKLRIVHFWADGAGTYTPPGHWNAIACEDFVKERFSEARWARNLALLNMALFDAAICCWDAKYYYFNQRPSQADPNIKTWTGVPNFPAYVSGHSTFSGAAATILGHILPSRSAAYDGMAQEASMSRLYGCIHYRSDCDAGLKLGKGVGNKAITVAQTDGAE
ncbi:MAG: phosphatase PAP2 family protein [Bacteroidia bacterium]|nr:phosphatase PAP2 family protein [Bacteroidia bacterium]